MNIVIIGPMPPWRGGIAHSNAVLCRNLVKRNRITAISFRRMFPEFLYPGKSQKSATAPPEDIRIVPMLDSLNPITWIRAYRMVKQERVDLLVFQWWSPFFTPCYSVIAWLVRMGTRTRVSVVCQNVISHEGRWIETALTKLFFRDVDFFITYSSSDKEEVRRLLPQAKVAYIVEGTYDMQVGKSIGKGTAKRLLRMTGKNILFFGFVRHYKGLHYLLQAMPLVLQEEQVTLHIVGECWEDRQQYLQEITRLGLKKNARMVDRYVSDEEAIRYFSAADAVVLPYTSSTESGIIQLAYGLNTPIITTDVGGNKDLIEHGKSGLLVRPGDAADLAEKILMFYEKKMEPIIRQGMRKKMRIFSWTEEKERIFQGEF